MALSRIGFAHALAVMALLATPRIATAEMLDEPACNQLKNEQQRLAADGLKTEMLHGPDWAKANLPASRMEQIKHLMEVEEQINFRCPLPPPPKAPEPAAAAPGEDGAAAPKITKKKKGKKQREEAIFEIPQVDLPGTGPEKPAAEQPVKKKAKAKKKPANDAFVPPSPQGNAFVDGEAGPVPNGPPSGPSPKAQTP
ncbi:MAG: hypothetical protein Q7T86_08475 [Hyphomicrobiaceae bacterium]|nr:hypothetical protein [Hyphomicrobiaceae bacterium]